MKFTILRFDALGSTNTEAANQARLGAGEGLCVIARSQTGGRGRHGREWISGKDAGLYFSVLLRPRIELRFLPLITLMAGVAVHDTLLEVGLQPDIKWVNDILIGEKKISGILAETVETPSGLGVVVGIGINLTAANIHDPIHNTATSIEAETGSRIGADDLAEILTRYLSYFEAILSGPSGPPEILQHWRQRSTYFSGKQVRVTTAHGPIDGVTDGLEENGSLRVKTADGSVKIIQAGDVERVRPHHK